ncbi:DNase/tRNase domain of colicin-like bacteriocin [Treponema bryantii]|uniref:DNase/tRNase domain of colicin-like bacteriocin n=1 Tax=Treponema bryantii TaxID=163 RepID=A0A1I3LN70_9SPIR|nr:HNH endonuclease [Treponema bryantii]SFI86143.1 DNase/tRNase domain of colicin-like bacteriocin [Treponema bryantii]
MKKNISNRIIAFFLLLLFELNLCFSATYSGTSYSGKQNTPVTYAGTPIEPFEYDGELLYPISYSGSVINGVYYEGIDLTNYKITTLKITGKETDADIFNESVPAEYRVNWKKVLGKYAVGTTVIVITGVVSLCSGTIPLATAGYIAAGAFKGAITGSIIGGAVDAFISGTLSFIKGNPKEQIFKEAIEASADGFMWGAITGAVAGGFKSAKELSKGIPVLNSKGKIQYVIDSSTNQVYLAKGSELKGQVFNVKDKAGNYKFFYDKNNSLYNFDGKLVADKWYQKNSGIISNKKTNQIIGYIDTKGNLNIDDDIYIALKNDIHSVPYKPEKELNKFNIHRETGVSYHKKIVKDIDGVQYEGMFPIFETPFEAQIPTNLYYATDKKQFEESTRQICKLLESKPKLKKQFTNEQLKQIYNLETPSGFTWHHTEDPGRMQLVNTKVHADTKHTGGRYIWGGGKSKRR